MTAVFAAAAAVLIIWGICEARFILKVRHHRIGTRGIRIAYLSDLHCGFFFSPKRLEKVIQRVQELSPDLVLLGGDYVEGGPTYARECLEALSRLSPAAAVLGNHDIQDSRKGSAREAAAAVCRSLGIPLLYNSCITVQVKGITLQIAGPADARRDTAYLGHIRRDPSADIMILLSHNPDFIPSGAQHLDFDLALCGHTHGGQITLFGRPLTTHSKYRKELGRGLCRWKGKPVVVSCGLGTTIMPLRFFASPSIETADL